MDIKRKTYKKVYALRSAIKKIKIKARLKKPEGADWFISGLYYKIGRFGWIFCYCKDKKDWLKTTRTPCDILADLRSDDKTCFSFNKKAKGENS